ncbi:equilibrative nucleoside transporter 3 [Echinococcus multilocularis]|uniref:Equilibrative nucleoside transporter 3 n=1 Tax=Echinococcus multilocularis TaxID=6211 RepID=A0A068YH69_ECHMU|nr:equilibrative nucleoside transporter 3 [Echinococcus multilocularis]
MVRTALSPPGPRYLQVPTFFVPFFLFSTYHVGGCDARRRMPLWIKNGQICVVGFIVSIFTTGYFFFLAMIYTPKCVRPPYSPLPTSVFP